LIDVYYALTPNGRKMKLFFAEVPLPHRMVRVRLGQGEQFRPEFLAISPNNKIPAIVDHQPADGGAPVSMFESGAILMYLAQKSGRLLPPDARSQSVVLQWLFWQVGGLGPMSGQLEHFHVYAPEKVPYALARYARETRRLYGVLDRRLADRPYIAGDEYSIADLACYPWIAIHPALGETLDDFAHVRRWHDAIAARPATISAYEEQ
jgi:GSH-dependent disulfide-bond oxidoreductase